MALSDTAPFPALDELTREVLNRSRSPEDHYEVAAVLESIGWSDKLARESFGVRDVFELAENVCQSVRAKVVTEPAVAIEPPGLLPYVMRIFRSFLRGTIFAYPIAISIYSILVLRYSLWSYMYFTVDIATSIAIGTILSFMTVGGFMQAIARRGFFYLINNEYTMARRMTFYFIRLGLFISVIVGATFFLFNLAFTIFPWNMILVCLFYYIFLTVCWLSVTVMYILRKEIVFTLLLSGGIALVFILHEWLRVNIMLAQMVALTLVSAAGLALAAWIFRRAERKSEEGITPPLPRMSIVFYTSIPYFTYGFLYFTFLYVDRIIAWSANDNYMPYLIWFRGEYELGLDWALLTLIIPMGLVEAMISDFYLRLEDNQKIYKAREDHRFNSLYHSLYIRYLLYYCVLSIFSGLLIYFSILKIEDMHIFDLTISISKTTFFVFQWSVVAYVVTAAGLLGALFLFCLDYTGPVIRGILWACAADVGVGFVLSRWVDYSWAVFGLLAGAVVFAGYTNLSVLRVLKKLDYHLYSSS